MKTALKTSTRKLLFTRIESTAVAGVPDILIADERGRFCMVELKFVNANAVSLRPHQVSWLTRHQHTPSYILVKKQKDSLSKSELYLYSGDQAIDVKTDGLKTKPLLHQHQPFNWSVVFQIICPNS